MNIPNAVLWGEKPFEYLCSNGHSSGAKTELKRCPIHRCEGTLRRVGKGSRSHQH